MQAKRSFYPDGSTSGDLGNLGEQQQGTSSEGWHRRESWASTAPSGFSSNQSQHYDWEQGAWTQESQRVWGRWFWTPQAWVWGVTLEEGIQDYLTRGWMVLDRELIEWMQQSTDGASSKRSSHFSERLFEEVKGDTDGNASQASRRSMPSGEKLLGEGEGDGSQASRRRRDAYGDSDGDDDPHEKKNYGGKKPCTGKDYIPEHDGTLTMREYERRVRLFETTTSIDEEYRAGKLLQKLSGEAWNATESLDVATLKTKGGVNVLLQHLWNELEPLQYLRTCNTLSYFFKTFRRAKGQEMVSFDTAFRGQCKRLEEVGSPLVGTAKAFWFLEKAGLSEEVKRQVVSSAGGEYEYSRLRSALVAIIPQVKRQEMEEPASKPQGGHKGFGRGGYHRSSNRVHAVDQGGEQSGEEEPEGAPEDLDGDEEAEQLELEAEVLLTHAARKRAEATKNRGFAKGDKGESQEERNRRIREMKTRMPCAACKAAGKTVYGHWHGDPECPQQKKKVQDGKAGATFVVSQEQSDSDSEAAFYVADQGQNGAHFVGAIVLATAGRLREMCKSCALADTCCARTVAGMRWMEEHLRTLSDLGIPYVLVEDSQPFRFGDGPKIVAGFGAVFPMFVGQVDHAVLVRVSVVDQDVPLLLSSNALKQLGTRFDLDDEEYYFKKLGTGVKMLTTPSGHIGFPILEKVDEMRADLLQVDWSTFVKTNGEIAFSRCNEDRVWVTHVPRKHRGPMKRGIVSNGCKRDSHNQDEQNACHVAEAVGSESSDCVEPGNSSIRSNGLEDVLCRECPQEQEPVEEGRLCDSTGGENVAGCTDPKDFDCGAPQVHPQQHEAEGCSDPTEQLETVFQSRIDGVVRREDPAKRQRVPSHDKRSSHRRVGDVCGRGGDRESRGQDHGTPSASVSRMCGGDGGTSQPGGWRKVLRMCHVPQVQSHDADDLPRSTNRSDSEHAASKTWLQRSVSGWWRRDERRCGEEGNSHSSSIPIGVGQGESGKLHDQPCRFSSCISSGDCRREGIDPGTSPVSTTGEEEVRVDEGPKDPLPRDEVRRRILAGNYRRREAKKGTIKRLIGNCSNILATACFFTAMAAVSAGGLFKQVMCGDSRPDVIEIFAGTAEVSLHMARRGWNVSEPVDIVFGSDLRDSVVRDDIKDFLRTHKPRLAIVSYPCRFWTKLSDVNYRTPQRKRKLEKLRKEEEPFLEFTEDVFNIQLEQGGDALAENPLASMSFRR